jgi:hypothetical protein
VASGYIPEAKIDILNTSQWQWVVASGYIPEAKIDTHGGGAGGSIRPNSRCFSGERRFSEEPVGLSASSSPGGGAISWKGRRGWAACG